MPDKKIIQPLIWLFPKKKQEIVSRTLTWKLTITISTKTYLNTSHINTRATHHSLIDNRTYHKKTVYKSKQPDSVYKNQQEKGL